MLFIIHSLWWNKYVYFTVLYLTLYQNKKCYFILNFDYAVLFLLLFQTIIHCKAAVSWR